MTMAHVYDWITQYDPNYSLIYNNCQDFGTEFAKYARQYVPTNHHWTRFPLCCWSILLGCTSAMIFSTRSWRRFVRFYAKVRTVRFSIEHMTKQQAFCVTGFYACCCGCSLPKDSSLSTLSAAWKLADLLEVVIVHASCLSALRFIWWHSWHTFSIVCNVSFQLLHRGFNHDLVF